MKLKKVTEKVSDAVSEWKDRVCKWSGPAEEEKKWKTVMLVGAVCSAVLIIAAAVTVAVIVLRKKQQKQLEKDNCYDPEIIDSTEEE